MLQRPATPGSVGLCCSDGEQEPGAVQLRQGQAFRQRPPCKAPPRRPLVPARAGKEGFINRLL